MQSRTVGEPQWCANVVQPMTTEATTIEEELQPWRLGMRRRAPRAAVVQGRLRSTMRDVGTSVTRYWNRLQRCIHSRRVREPATVTLHHSRGVLDPVASVVVIASPVRWNQHQEMFATRDRCVLEPNRLRCCDRVLSAGTGEGRCCD